MIGKKDKDMGFKTVKSSIVLLIVITIAITGFTMIAQGDSASAESDISVEVEDEDEEDEVHSEVDSFEVRDVQESKAEISSVVIVILTMIYGIFRVIV